VKTLTDPTVRDYVAGAALANSLAWLTLGITFVFEINLGALLHFMLSAYLFGGILAGYLVSRKASQGYLKAGLKTGAGAFILHIYVFMGVLELLWGQRVLLLWDHLLIFAVFLMGSLVGAILLQHVALRVQAV